ncbi:MAG TPA: GNAT family N-acetyltransferase [Streptosporangiaceae bacterium]|nr:GNAT family N-acetyltransferase [Streptosporangiaceae bacterium]
MIRPGRAGDIPAIHQMVRDLAAYERGLHEVTATQDDLRAALLAPRPSLFAHVAEEDGQLVGFALWFLNYSSWAGRHGIYLEDLYVAPERRGQGHGRALLAELARICVERGYRRLEWWVLDWNSPARAFYESLGAVPMDEWTVHRLTGPALDALAELTPPG